MPNLSYKNGTIQRRKHAAVRLSMISAECISITMMTRRSLMMKQDV